MRRTTFLFSNPVATALTACGIETNFEITGNVAF